MTTSIDRRRREMLKGVGASLALAAAAPRAARAMDRPSRIQLGGHAVANGPKLALSSYTYVLDKQGWLRAQLARQDIELSWFGTAHSATGPMINEAFANRTLQFAVYGDLPSVILNAGGVQTRIVVPNGVGGLEAFLVVPTQSKARTLEDLKGKTIAVHRGRPWELPLVRLLDSRRLTYADFKIYNMNPPAGMAALVAKRVDALFTTFDAYVLEERGLGRIIWSTRQAPLDWIPRTELFAAKSFIDRYPDLTQTVVTAYVKAAHWASQPENREELIKAASSERPESVQRRTWDDDSFEWKDRWSPLFNDHVYEHYRKVISIAREKKIIGKPLDADNLFDTRFVGPALRELQLTDYWKPFTAKVTQARG